MLENVTGIREMFIGFQTIPSGSLFGGRFQLTCNMAELEAESVAYIVCQHFGLDSSVRSAAYIALWQGDSKALKASLQRIADTARTMIDDVDAIECRKAVA